MTVHLCCTNSWYKLVLYCCCSTSLCGGLNSTRIQTMESHHTPALQMFGLVPMVCWPNNKQTNKHIIIIPWAVKAVTVGKAPPFPYSPLHRSGMYVYNGSGLECGYWMRMLALYLLRTLGAHRRHLDIIGAHGCWQHFRVHKVVLTSKCSRTSGGHFERT